MKFLEYLPKPIQVALSDQAYATAVRRVQRQIDELIESALEDIELQRLNYQPEEPPPLKTSAYAAKEEQWIQEQLGDGHT
jgi:hypothetical protein